MMGQIIGTASEADLGGKKLAHGFATKIGKARTLVGDPTTTRKLKRATKQVKQFSTKLAKALGRGKVKADLGAALGDLAAQAADELAGLITPAP
jgi:hypothetical protein